MAAEHDVGVAGCRRDGCEMQMSQAGPSLISQSVRWFANAMWKERMESGEAMRVAQINRQPYRVMAEERISDKRENAGAGALLCLEC